MKKSNVRKIRVNHARGCSTTNDLRFIVVPYVAYFEEDFRPVTKYAIVDALIGQVTQSNFSDEDSAWAEVLSYYDAG